MWAPRTRDRGAGTDHCLSSKRALVAQVAVAPRQVALEAARKRMSFSIDIVIPVYNAPDHVRRCVDSVLAHNHDDCRITLIDDGSSDPRIAALFAELQSRQLPQLGLLRNDSNRGFIATANRGIAG